MRTIRVVAMAAVLAMCASAADVQLELHLKRAVREEAIEQEFLARATPGSKKYMQHLSVQQLAELVRPRAGAAEAVDAFLAQTSGATGQGKFVTGDVVKATVSTGTAAAARLGVAGEHSQPVIPAELAPHVERILVARALPRQHGGRAKRQAAVITSTSQIQDQFAGMTQNPFTIFARYNVPNTTVASTTVQGVCEFNVPMGFSQAAMDLFNEHYGLAKTQVKLSGPNPTQSQQFGASEGQLDVEYIAAMAPGATTWWIQAPGTATWPQWCDQVLSLSPLPDVVSISWGTAEWYFQVNLTGTTTSSWPSVSAPIPPLPASVTAAEDAFRKLALAGVTSVAASGDDGPSSWGPNTIFGPQCSSRFGPGYPATSRYVTAVGATYADTETSPEVSVSWSGGGFSEFIAQPSWQKTAVEAYLNAKLPDMPPAAMYNASGRAYPDVAALGTNFAVAGAFQTVTSTFFSKQETIDGWSGVAGTSAASPTFAGIITRVVAERKAKGKGTLGCINPTLYSLGKVGQDVTKGKTGNGCLDPSSTGSAGYGFPVTQGWDPATGLGTPDYQYLLAQLA